MKKIKNQVGFSFLSFLLFIVFLVSSSHGATYYYKNKSGVLIYTNIPPTEKGYKRITLPEQTHISSFKGSLRPFTYSKKYDDHIDKTAKWYGVDPNLVKAIIKVESNFDSTAVSPKGAMGVMQLMPDTARDHSVSNPFDPLENIRGGVKYLRKLIEMFNGNLRLALAGYNAGENAVIKHGYTIPPYNETMNYVDKVLAHYNYLKTKFPNGKDKKAVQTEQEPKIGEKSLAKGPPASLEEEEIEEKAEPQGASIKEERVSSSAEATLEAEKMEEVNNTEFVVPPAVNSDGRFTVQIASFQELKEAQEMEQALKSKAFPAFIQKADLPGKGTWYRVRVGVFSTKEEAKKYRDTIRSIEPEIRSVFITLNK